MARYRLRDRFRGTLNYIRYRIECAIPSYPAMNTERPDPAMDREYFIKIARAKRHSRDY